MMGCRSSEGGGYGGKGNVNSKSDPDAQVDQSDFSQTGRFVEQIGIAFGRFHEDQEHAGKDVEPSGHSDGQIKGDGA